MIELGRIRPAMPVLMLVWLCRGKRFRRRSLHSASSVVAAIIVAIMAERPLGSNTRSSTVRMASPPWLIGSRAITVASLVMQAAPTGNIMVELWSEIIVIRLMQ